MKARDPSVAWIDGRLVPWGEARVPLEDRGLQFAESLYEVLPVTAGKVRLLEEHAERLERGAALLEMGDGAPDGARLASIAERLLAEERLREGLLYVQLSGGVAPREHAPSERPRPVLWAYLRETRFPRASEAKRGIRVITMADARWEFCDLKTTMLLPAVMGRREAARRGAQEALLIDPQGYVREGTSCNVFIVERRAVVSPEPTRHVLPGITGPLVSRLASESGRQVARARISIERLKAADEVFVTSTSRLALGVTAVDGQPVGGGKPGPAALELAALLRREFEL